MLALILIRGLSAGLAASGSILSTTTASECGSSSLKSSRAASLMNSATIVSTGSSVNIPSGYKAGPSGRSGITKFIKTSRFALVLALIGIISFQLQPVSLPSSSNSTSLSAISD